ncbi:MAG: hypothetical protein JXR96_21990 [Deltaproteobacteria bacterium]|nr:hypothetical protein [Deltaproteobacteria bacterium]
MVSQSIMWCFEQQPGGPAACSDAEAETGLETGPRRAVVCAGCGFGISSSDQAVEVDGRHAHTFFNPAGILFEIGCYREASGCIAHGRPTDEFAWFPGFNWRYAACGGCGQHLGWLFESRAGSAFFGLVLERIVELGSGGEDLDA